MRIQANLVGVHRRKSRRLSRAGERLNQHALLVLSCGVRGNDPLKGMGRYGCVVDDFVESLEPLGRVRPYTFEESFNCLGAKDQSRNFKLPERRLDDL